MYQYKSPYPWDIYLIQNINDGPHCMYVYIGESFTSLSSLMLNQRVSAQIGSRKG